IQTRVDRITAQKSRAHRHAFPVRLCKRRARASDETSFKPVPLRSLPTQVGRKSAIRNVLVERLEPHEGRTAEFTVRKSHAAQASTKVLNRLTKRAARHARWCEFRKQGKVNLIG